MGSGGGNSTQTVIQQQNLPQWYQDYLKDMIGRGVSEAAAPAPIYSGPRIAPMTNGQNTALSEIGGAQGLGNAQINAGVTDLQSVAGNNPLDAANPYLGAGAGYFGQAGQTNIAGGLSPYLSQAQGYIGQGASANLLGLANPYVQQATAPTGLASASPYLNAASQSLPDATMANMNPYTSGAMNALSNQAAYDLNNKYLPAVNDSFIRAGQFGSTRNQDITAQTIHDTSQNVLNAQAGLLNSSYGQAGQLAESNLGLQGQLAQTAGGLGAQQQQTLLGAGSTLGTLGGAQAGLQLQGGAQTGQLGQAMAAALGQQGQLQLGAGQGMAGLGATAGGLANAFNNSRIQAGLGLGQLGNLQSNMTLSQANALYGAGSAQQGQTQKGYDTGYNDWVNQTFYPQNQTSWLSNIVRGLPSTGAGYTTNTSTPTNTGAQIGGLLTAGTALAGTQGVMGANPGSYPGRKGGTVKKNKIGEGRVTRGLGQFKRAA